MNSQKVLNPSQIKWYDDQPRLNYQMLFEESEEPEVEVEDKQEVETQLFERDEKWRNKLKFAREKAHKEGFESGYEKGVETAKNEIDSKIQVIKTAIDQGHEEWNTRQKMVEAGLMDLAFDIAENILGIPIENEAIRKHLDEKLIPILQMLDEESKPSIKVSSADYEYVKMLKEKHAEKLTVLINIDDNCNPGEFELDTHNENIVHKFKEMLKDFRKNLTLPTWK